MTLKSEVRAGLAGTVLTAINGIQSNLNTFETTEALCTSFNEDVSVLADPGEKKVVVKYFTKQPNSSIGQKSFLKVFSVKIRRDQKLTVTVRPIEQDKFTVCGLVSKIGLCKLKEKKFEETIELEESQLLHVETQNLPVYYDDDDDDDDDDDEGFFEKPKVKKQKPLESSEFFNF
eukprot:GHVP01048753.1.p1 GENE.GHVP01048753.1~~GHVP01048753.1.p1  ORF type:complete len:175 (-),score=42.32 GHVP01048753.1:13-537(-)